MPGLYSSRATKFLYLDGARMTGADGPLTKSESRDGTADRTIHAGRLGAARGRQRGIVERDDYA